MRLGRLSLIIFLAQPVYAQHSLSFPLSDPSLPVWHGWIYDDGISPHHGIDYVVPLGTPIIAADDGIAMSSVQPIDPTQPNKDAYGRFVLIQHANGLSTLYAHLNGSASFIYSAATRYDRNFALWTPVKKGDVVGFVGLSGVVTTQRAHLHFEAAINAQGDYLGHLAGKADPYAIQKVALYYPPAGPRFTSCGSTFLWITCPLGPPSGQWVPRTAFPGVANRFGGSTAVSFAIGSKGYIAIPCSIGVQCVGQFWQYDSQSNQWSQLGNHPSIQYQSPSFVVNGKAYVISGTQVWEYTPGSDQWLRKGDIPGVDKRAGFGFAVNGLGYIGGGFYNGGALWAYDPVTDTWTRKNDHPVLQFGLNDPSVRAVDLVTFTIGNKAYVTGTNSFFWEYSPAADTWTTKAYVDAVYGQAFSLNFTGYVFNTRGALYKYDVTTDRWTLLAPFPGATVCYPAGFAISNSLYVGVGGRFAANTCNLDVVNAWWQFQP